jgi:hypothetical protein
MLVLLRPNIKMKHHQSLLGTPPVMQIDWARTPSQPHHAVAWGTSINIKMFGMYISSNKDI